MTGVSARSAMPTRSSTSSTRASSSGVGPAPVAEVLPQPAVAAPGPLGHQQVLPHGHVGEDLDPLVGAADARAGPAGRRASRSMLVAVQRDRALLGPELAADAVEQRGLARRRWARPGPRSRPAQTVKVMSLTAAMPAERLGDAR